jgi:hypothetical protein
MTEPGSNCVKFESSSSRAGTIKIRGNFDANAAQAFNSSFAAMRNHAAIEFADQGLSAMMG